MLGKWMDTASYTQSPCSASLNPALGSMAPAHSVLVFLPYPQLSAHRLSGIVVLLAICVGLSGCARDDFGCGFRFVELRAPRLPHGTVGVPYDGIIESEIGNEPNDDDFEFRFFLGFGELPPGLTLRQINDQQAVVEGTPNTAGVFTFEVVVETWLEDDHNSRCDHMRRDRDFTIEVLTDV